MPHASRLNELSAMDAAAAIREKRIRAVELAEACLERIRLRQPEVRAWTCIDEALVLRQAEARDREEPKGLLHGLPFGVKDVIDTVDLPTAYGSPIYEGHRPGWDAACVALAGEAGGIVMGKTVTTEFATRHPGVTRNPLNLDHTPGGSSSGSAAAVADCMVPLAFGTQTSGSLIRPAAYCGIVGYKPTFGTIDRAGLKPLADSLDTIGVYGRTVPDAALFTAALSGRPLPDFEDDLPGPRVAFCRTPVAAFAEPETWPALERAVARLSADGAQVRELALPGPFDRAVEAQRTIVAFEVWRALSYERINHVERLSPTLRERLAEMARCTRAQYEWALDHAVRCRALLDDVFRACDVIVAPCAPGEAPRGLESTGDPVFSELWTALHVPCVAIPIGAGPAGLPLGLQVIAPVGQDERALRYAEWMRRRLAA